MFTIIGADGKEYGPVTADKIREWIANGRANAQTQCRREGEAAWSTLGSLGEFAGTFNGPPPMPGATAAATAGDGPIPMQQVDTKAVADAIAATGARIDVFGCIGQAFNLWTSNFLPLVGATALVIIIQFVVGMIPLVGAIAGLLLQGVFYGGLYYYYLGRMRGQSREIGDVFTGFKRALGPLVIVTLLQNLIMFACALVLMAPWLGFFVQVAFSGSQGSLAMPVMAPWLIVTTAIGVIVLVYIAVSLSFAYALVIDKGISPMNALVLSWRVGTRNWFALFFTLLLGLLLGMLGVIALIIGVFFTIPIAIGSVLYAYESLFKSLPSRS